MQSWLDMLAKVDWAAIISAAAQSRLGIVALASIILGIVVVVLFARERDARYRLAALILVLLGLFMFVFSVINLLPDAAPKPEEKFTWLNLGYCRYEKQLPENRTLTVGVGQYPPASKDDNSLIMRATIGLPSAEFRNRTGAACPFELEFLQSTVTFGVNKWNMRDAFDGTSDDLDCAVRDEVPVLASVGKSNIEATLNDIGKFKSIKLLINNGPKAKTEIVGSFDGLSGILNLNQCPEPLRDALKALNL
jgi:hypothetical protein